jgi:hypothetical protein
VTRALIEHWNGSNWKIQPSANPANTSVSFLNGVACVTESLCTAAGGYVDSAGTAQTLAERWNGTVWEIQPTPNPAGAFYVAFNGVSCPAERECTAVGFYVDGAFNFLTFAEHWNGTVWDVQVTPNPVGTNGPNGTLEGGVSCATPRACTAVGQWSPTPAPHPGISLAERWNGTSWQVQTTPNPAAVDAVNGTHNSPLAGVSCPTVNDCTAVGNYDSGDANGDFLALAERWNGTIWSVQQAATPVGAFFTSLHAVTCPKPAHLCCRRRLQPLQRANQYPRPASRPCGTLPRGRLESREPGCVSALRRKGGRRFELASASDGTRQVVCPAIPRGWRLVASMRRPIACSIRSRDTRAKISGRTV